MSTSNGIWVLNLETLEIERQVEGSGNPNLDGNDKPNTDSGSSLYYGQTGTMVLAGGKVFAVHQQYGLLVVDTQTDKVVDVLDMGIVDDVVEAETGKRPASGIGSTIVRSKDESVVCSSQKRAGHGSDVAICGQGQSYNVGARGGAYRRRRNVSAVKLMVCMDSRPDVRVAGDQQPLLVRRRQQLVYDLLRFPFRYRQP